MSETRRPWLTPSESTRYRQTRVGPRSAPARAIVRQPLTFSTIKNTMFDSELKKQILDSIETTGQVEDKEIKINTNISHVLDLSSGSPRINKTMIRKAVLIIQKPKELSILVPQQIRCVLCHRQISYPCWYYEVKYAVNHFHYFVCFDADSSMKPSVKCYRKG